MDLQLKDKVVIVTGGAKGIGQGITRAFVQEGAMAAVFDGNPEQSQDLVTALRAAGGQAEVFPVELTNGVAIADAVAAVRSRFGTIDVVVNNAGVNDGVSLEGGVDKFEESLRKNLVHYYALVHGALPALKASRGCVVNVGASPRCSHTTGQILYVDGGYVHLDRKSTLG